MTKRKTYYLYSYNYTSSKLFLCCDLGKSYFQILCKKSLYRCNYTNIRYLYSYNYSLTNFGLLLAFIGLFLNSIAFCRCTFAIQNNELWNC